MFDLIVEGFEFESESDVEADDRELEFMRLVLQLIDADEQERELEGPESLLEEMGFEIDLDTSWDAYEFDRIGIEEFVDGPEAEETW